jgi:hypothetical protein
MSYMIINHYERSALKGLPYLQQLTYLNGLKPYVDYHTEIIGIKRRVSYQSLSEELYIEPHQGFVQSGSPSKDQIRRSLKALEKAGLIEIQSLDKQLIFKCLLLDRDNSAQNKLATNPPYQAATNPPDINNEKSVSYDNSSQNADIPKSPKPAMPLNNNNNIILFFLLNAFEAFWERYPLKNDKENALEVFKKLNPSQTLLDEIMAGLQRQIEFHQSQQAAGVWLPAWKYPCNWLAQQCWKNAPMTIEPQQENHHATNQQNFAIQAANANSGHATTNIYSEAEFQKLWKMY